MCHNAGLHRDAASRVVFAALVLSAVAAVAQQCEFVIPIPESLGTPGQVMYASGEGKLYCYLPMSGRLAVINPETRELTGFVPTGRGMDTLSYSRRWQRLYCSGDSGLTFVRTTDNEIVFVCRDWGRSKLVIDPTQCRAFAYSSQNMLRSVNAATGEVLDSLTGIAYGDRMCFDPLHLRLWCRMSGVVDCSESLVYAGSVSDMYFPTYNPWDGLVYGDGLLGGIFRFDPVTNSGGVWWTTESTYVWQLALNAPGRRLYFFAPIWYGSMDFRLQTIEMPTMRVRSELSLDTPYYLYFTPTGKRVWASDGTNRTFVVSETLDYWSVCDSIGVVEWIPAHDVVAQRTFITDPARLRIVVFRDTLRDSSDVASTLVAGPATRLDTAATWVFRSTCVNMGILDKTIPLCLRVFAANAGGQKGTCDFTDTADVWVDGCGYGVAVFDTWRTSVRGEYIAEVTTEYPGDANPTNDTARCALSVWAPFRDVGPHNLTPQGLVDSGATIVPKAWILNAGGVGVTFPVLMSIGSTYADTQTVTLAANDTTQVSFDVWTASEVGQLTVRCSTMLSGDSIPENDVMVRWVRVSTPGGIVAGDSLPNVYSVGDWIPNPVSSVARLRYGLPQASSVTAVVYSVDGRQVKSVVNVTQPAGYHSIVWDGRDDAGQFCGPGVYFCHVRAGPLRKSTKLTLTH
jgi:hypothetical protein